MGDEEQRVQENDAAFSSNAEADVAIVSIERRASFSRIPAMGGSPTVDAEHAGHLLASHAGWCSSNQFVKKAKEQARAKHERKDATSEKKLKSHMLQAQVGVAKQSHEVLEIANPNPVERAYLLSLMAQLLHQWWTRKLLHHWWTRKL